MRWLVAIPALLVLAPAAQAATITREGTELVYRSDPGQEDSFFATGERSGVRFTGADIVAGGGCSTEEVRCSLDGITGIRLILGDGDDRAEIKGVELALAADLGPGDDALNFTATGAEVTGGAGADRVDGFNTAHATGTFRLDGGVGDDTLVFAGRVPGITLTGGEGDDLLALALTGPDGPPIDFVCGPGADRTIMEPQDRAGEGCARPVTGLSGLRRVSRTFREGRLEAPARATVTLRRRTQRDGLTLPVIARRTFAAPAGPLRARLRTTDAGRRVLRRTPRPPVWAFIRTSAASESATVIFASRLG